jgi:hypothetical protein
MTVKLFNAQHDSGTNNLSEGSKDKELFVIR